MSEQEQFEQEQKLQDIRSEQIEWEQNVQSDAAEPDMQQEQSGETAQSEQTMQQEQSGETAQSEQSIQSDNGIYATPDVYQSQTAQEIYRTPDMSVGQQNTGGLFSGSRSENEGNSTPDNNPYGNVPPANGTYDNNPYGNVPPVNGTYDNNPYGNVPPANGTYDNNPYGNVPPVNNPYEKNPYGKKAAGNDRYTSDQYGNNRYDNSYGTSYNQDPYGYNPYSPYAVPPQKKNTGLIIGVIIGVGALFLIAVFALFYHAIDRLAAKKEEPARVEEREDSSREDTDRDDYEDDYEDDRTHRNDDRNDYDDPSQDRDYFYDDDDHDYDYDDDHDYDYDDDHDYDYDDDHDYNYDDDEYYTLHDDIRRLSYSIDWEVFDYDADGDNVMITVEYPVIRGGNIPNREMINGMIEDEVGFFVDYYEDEYSNYMNGSDSYFYASSTAYVTYMSEDVLSVVFSEAVYSDYFDSISLYCMNIDVQNGVILDNTDILSVDDDFSIDFRYRSEIQNGTVDGLDRLSDQEITEMFQSAGNLIVFYTPQGLEVGLNYDEGYVTVTYHDYKQYLKTF